MPVMGFVIAIALAWAWLSATSAKLLAEDAQNPHDALASPDPQDPLALEGRWTCASGTAVPDGRGHNVIHSYVGALAMVS